MSILLIGQRRGLYPPQRQSLAINEDIDDLSKAKRKEKEQYRLDLLEQMRDGFERRKKQKLKEIEEDRYYERLFYEQIGKPQSRYQTQPNYAPKYQARFSEFSTPQPKRYKEANLSLPPLEKDYSFKNKLSRMHTEPVESPYHAQYSSKLRTENTYESDKSDKRYANLFQLDPPEQRQKKLQQELDIKLQEIYSLMSQSTKTMREAEELDKIRSKLAPITLDLEKKGYKVKYPDSVSPAEVNPEENRDYFKLPNISKEYKHKQLSEQQSEAEWREWYAKQKLKELESKYQRDLNLQASDIRLNLGTKTPKFQWQQQVR